MYKGILRLKKMGSNREQKKNFEKLPLFFCKCEKIQNITKNRKKIQNKYVYTTR